MSSVYVPHQDSEDILDLQGHSLFFSLLTAKSCVRGKLVSLHHKAINCLLY